MKQNLNFYYHHHHNRATIRRCNRLARDLLLLKYQIMNTSKRINVNVSSLVGLKAELLRKHTEVKDAKAKIEISKPTLPRAKVKNKKVRGKNEKVKKTENVTEIEDVNMLKKSRYMLLAKTKLYNKLKKNRGENSDDYLVDFKNKHHESSEDESSIEGDNYEDTNIDPEEDWIDYKDCFGRTRKCLRKDLPRMKEKDCLIEREIAKKPHLEEREERIEPPLFIPPEKEPEIEIMRKKWEEQTEKLTQKSDIHYQDILFDEARAHGVGYYAFSHDEDERAKQQSNLAKLRKETEQKQKELQEIKDLKSKMEENRLKTARMRARIRAGLPPEPTEEETNNDSPRTENEMTVNNETAVHKSPKKDEPNEYLDKSECKDEDSLMVIEDKIRAFGELLGKRLPWRELSQEEWVDKRRKDRQGEFAPVYDNFKSTGMLVGTKHNQLTARKSNDNDDPLRIGAGGPEPTDIWESSAPVYHEDGNDTAEKFSSTDKIPTHEQSRVSMNLSESLSFIHPVPPPVFNPAIPPPSVIGAIPLLSVPAVNTHFNTSPAVFHPVPPPLITNSILPAELYNHSLSYSLNPSQVILTDSTNAESNQKSYIESSSDSDSDHSDIVGPMPPPSIRDDDVLARIPFPASPSSTGPQDLLPNCLDTESESLLENTNIDKIAAGLKYLRQKFETNNTS